MKTMFKNGQSKLPFAENHLNVCLGIPMFKLPNGFEPRWILLHMNDDFAQTFNLARNFKDKMQ